MALRDAIVEESGVYRVEDLGMLGIAELMSIIKDVWKPYSQAHSRAVSALARIAGFQVVRLTNPFLIKFGRFWNKLQQICKSAQYHTGFLRHA